MHRHVKCACSTSLDEVHVSCCGSQLKDGCVLFPDWQEPAEAVQGKEAAGLRGRGIAAQGQVPGLGVLAGQRVLRQGLSLGALRPPVILPCFQGLGPYEVSFALFVLHGLELQRQCYNASYGTTGVSSVCQRLPFMCTSGCPGKQVRQNFSRSDENLSVNRKLSINKNHTHTKINKHQS